MAGRGGAGFFRFLISQGSTQRAIAAVLLLLCVGVLGRSGGSLLPEIAALTCVAVVGAPIFWKGLRAFWLARKVTIDLLMGIASLGAAAIGESGEAAAVVLLFTLGEALETYSAERSRDALRSLLALQPDEATVLVAHGEREEALGHAPHHNHDQTQHRGAGQHFHQHQQSTDSVPVGAWILVRPGARIPLDGRIVRGHSQVNQAAVTGESLPLERGVGEEVLAGTVNGSGALTLEVLRPANLSTITRIARMVEKALAERTPAERFVDRFARWYTPLVLVLAALVVAIPVLVFGQPFLHPAGDTQGWLYRGLALLIIACPCALIISIPVTVVSALTRLAQLDRLAGVNIIAFDKTGTLTTGHPVVTALNSRNCAHLMAAPVECPNCADLLAVAAAVESASEHPLAQAVLTSARDRGVTDRLPQAANIQAHPGRGVSGELGGEFVGVGTHALFQHGPECANAICAAAATLQTLGKTVLLVGLGPWMLGYIGVEDQPRPESQAALKALHALQPLLKTVMLTGDNQTVAEAIAQQIGGIDEVRANLLPEHKQGAIRQLQTQGTVAMVGDGINDAPALAQADIGIAMGGGTVQAMETADVVLMQANLQAITTTLRISRLTRAVVKQNITLSLGLKLAVMGLTMAGFASLWLAVLADVGATLVVTLNGMRMLRAR